MKKMFGLLAFCSVILFGILSKPSFGVLTIVNPHALDTEPSPTPTSTDTPTLFLPFVMKDFIFDFFSQFDDSAFGWIPVSGDWKLENGSYTALGIQGAWTSVSYMSSYKNYYYEAKLKRSDCLNCAYGLILRGQPEPFGDANRWHSGYGFYITRNGYFGVFIYTNGNDSPLQDWMTTDKIDQKEDASNVLLVKADGDKLSYFINDMDNPVWEGQDSVYISGKVGILMYTKKGSTGSQIWVDWAKLTQIFMDYQ